MYDIDCVVYFDCGYVEILLKFIVDAFERDDVIFVFKARIDVINVKFCEFYVVKVCVECVNVIIRDEIECVKWEMCVF